MRLLSSKAQVQKEFFLPPTPYHVGIHWKALAENSQMSTRVSAIFQVFLYRPNQPSPA